MTPTNAGISVVKAHAYGNDFLLVPAVEVEACNLPDLARRMCDRHAGIGADGLIVHGPASANIGMRLFNADGSSSQVSGNGIRCLAALALRDRPAASTVTIETAAGNKHLELIERAGGRLTFRAAMGRPDDIHVAELEAAGERVRAVVLWVGNPQCVLLGDPLDESRMKRLGPALERHPAFPDRTNVSFARVESPTLVRILIWERGVGPTAASGTGACGAAVAAAAYGGAAREVDVVSPGGSQRVEWREEGLYLTGWAELLLEGRWLAVSM